MQKISFIRKPEAVAQLALSHTKIYRLVREGLIPSPVKVGKTSAWPQHEIDQIAKAFLAGLDEDEIKRLVTKIMAERKNFEQ